MRQEPMERVAQGASEQIVRTAAEYFEECLWESEVGERISERLVRAGLERPTMREFGVGYAPGDVKELLSIFDELGYSDEELVAARVVTTSGRGYASPRFHA